MRMERDAAGNAVFSFALPGPAQLPARRMRLRIAALSCGAVRVTRTMRDRFLDARSEVVTGAEPAEARVSEAAEGWRIRCGELDVTVSRRSGSVAFRTAEGRQLLAEDGRRPCQMEEKPVMLNRFRREGNVTIRQSVDGIRASSDDYETYEDRKAYTCRLNLTLNGEEGLYGLGSHEEGYGNLRGRSRELYQHNMKAVVPMLISTGGWGLLLDLGCLMTFHDDAEGTYLWADCADEMDYYFLPGDAREVYRQYAALTGPAPLLPRYAFGFVQSRERYCSAAELIDTVQEYRRRRVPLDVIVQDWQTWPEGQWGWKHFDGTRYPDPAAMTETLHKMGAKLMLSIWPSMQGERNEDRREMLENDCMLGNRVIYNAFDSRARELYWRQARDGLFRYGVDAWWCDCSEPFEGDWHGAIRPEPFERVRLNTEEARKYLDPAKISLYSLYHSMGIYQGQRRETEEKRVLNLTRSSWAGQHRYATVTWSGDVSSTWEVLRRQLPEGLNFMAAGEGWWSTDAGGFFPASFGGAWFAGGDFPDGVKDPGFRELFVRWMQLSAFLPMMRAHGTGTPREIWQFGEKGEPWYDALEKIIRLRSRMVPLLYSLAAEYARDGVPMVRVPALMFPEDSRLRQIDDEMMLGRDLLVKPVTRPMGFLPGGEKIDSADWTEEVYLPAGAGWYDPESGECLQGGCSVRVSAPLDRVPVFVRAGAIVLLGPVRQFTEEETEEPMSVTVYPGEDGSFVWYEDAGDGYGYEKGQCARVTLRWLQAEETLVISGRQGSYPGMREEIPLRVSLCGKEARTVRYTGQELRLRL